jgi:hypothetical protein
VINGYRNNCKQEVTGNVGYKRRKIIWPGTIATSLDKPLMKVVRPAGFYQKRISKEAGARIKSAGRISGTIPIRPGKLNPVGWG